MMASRAGLQAATQALLYAAPVGEKEEYVERLLKVVRPFLPEPPAAGAQPERPAAP
jgi:hypothetical protein